MRACNRVLALHDGKIVQKGSYDPRTEVDDG
jgi:hypothetical protein